MAKNMLNREMMAKGTRLAWVGRLRWKAGLFAPTHGQDMRLPRRRLCTKNDANRVQYDLGITKCQLRTGEPCNFTSCVAIQVTLAFLHMLRLAMLTLLTLRDYLACSPCQTGEAQIVAGAVAAAALLGWGLLVRG